MSWFSSWGWMGAWFCSDMVPSGRKGQTGDLGFRTCQVSGGWVDRPAGYGRNHQPPCVWVLDRAMFTVQFQALQHIAHQLQAQQRAVQRHQVVFQFQRHGQQLAPAVGDPAAVLQLRRRGGMGWPGVLRR